MKYFFFPKIRDEHIGRFSVGAQPLTLLILYNIFKESGFSDIIFNDENITDESLIFSELNKNDSIFISINLFNQERAIQLINKVTKTNAKIIIGGPILELAKGNISKIGLKPNKNIICLYGGWQNIIDFLSVNFKINILNHSWDGLHKYQSHRISTQLIEKYKIKHKEYSGFNYSGNYTNIHSKLGCKFRIKTGGCNFCSRYFENYEELCPSSLVNLLKKIWQENNVNFFWDSSDSFFNSNLDLDAYCKAGITELPIQLMIFSRLNNINANTAYLLKKCNVRSVIVGVESGSDRILKIANKHLTVKQTFKALDFLSKYDISIIPCLTIGHPTENINDLESTIKLAQDLAKNYKIDGFSCSPIMPIPNSNYFKRHFNNIENINLNHLFSLQEYYFTKFVSFDLESAKTICHELETLNNLKPINIWGDKVPNNEIN